jgi:DNA-binding transcriptional ArsR family regulator
MTELYEKKVRQRGVMITDSKRARAIGDPIRSAILQILSEKEASIAEIRTALKRKGVNIAPTTVRHHVDILKKAGLIELTKLVDSRGGVLKYYASNVRLIEHTPPKDFEEALDEAIEEAAEKVSELFQKISSKHGRGIEKMAEALKPCPYCSKEHFREYVLLEVLNRAVARATGKKEFRDLIA